jgi:hypothetical protein
MNPSRTAPARRPRIRQRRDEWIRAGSFARLAAIARDAYDRLAVLLLADIAPAPASLTVASPA